MDPADAERVSAAAAPYAARMRCEIHRSGGTTLWYDPDLWPDARAGSLDFAHRSHRGGECLDSGRGNALIWTRADGREWVLRHYRRGGWIARLSPDRYVWLGEARSRAWREFTLLQALHAEGLPVPRPVAARVVHEGPFYRQDLVTERVPGAHPLSERLQQAPLPPEGWAALGQTLGRFHRAGVGHADLNAANILVDDQGGFFLIDFDRGRRPASRAFQARALGRLRASLDKWAGRVPRFHFQAADWAQLTRALPAAGGGSGRLRSTLVWVQQALLPLVMV